MTDNNPQGGLAQLGEHLLCKQGVTGSIPVASTKLGGASLGGAYRILVLPVLAPSALRVGGEPPPKVERGQFRPVHRLPGHELGSVAQLVRAHA